MGIVHKIFLILWKKRLGEDKLVKVTGWRSALIDRKSGGRFRTTFCLFPWD
jgi:hypothetical protein